MLLPKIKQFKINLRKAQDPYEAKCETTEKHELRFNCMTCSNIRKPNIEKM